MIEYPTRRQSAILAAIEINKASPRPATMQELARRWDTGTNTIYALYRRHCGGYPAALKRGPQLKNEYHHHQGYAVEHHYDVVPLCSSCHQKAHPRKKRV